MPGEGSAFGKYYLLKKLATGGMGEVFLAQVRGSVGFEKLVVIKRILAEHSSKQSFLDMFFTEARVAATLSHTNIVQIYEMGEIDGAYFIAMEYVHGKNLRLVLKRGRDLGESLHPEHVIKIIADLASGLSYAHNARNAAGLPLNIIHRDINPQNLLISYGGDVKLIDFGIAKSEVISGNTEMGTIKGKFVYMSPEQSTAAPLDRRSDIFAVGICLYEALTLNNPFIKNNVVSSIDAIQRLTPPPLGQISPRLAPFDPIIARALAKDRQQRYNDCSELRDDLLQLLESDAVPLGIQSLSESMRDLFDTQIAEENRALMEASASARANSSSPDTTHTSEDRVRTIDLGHRPSRNRRAFITLLMIILVASFWGTLAARQLGKRARDATAVTVTEAKNQPVAIDKGAVVKRADYGQLIVSTLPKVAIRQERKTRLGPIALGKVSTGELRIGTGRHNIDDPLALQVEFRVSQEGMRYQIKSTRPALVLGRSKPGKKRKSVYLGRTPVVVRGGDLVKLTVLGYGGRRLELTLLYQP